MRTFDDLDRYAGMVRFVRKAYPGSRVLQARSLYLDTNDWHDKWPRTLTRLTRLVFFAEPDGVIGSGVLKEVTDAAAAGIPVEYLTPDGHLVPRRDVYIRPLEGWSRSRFVEVVTCERGGPR